MDAPPATEPEADTVRVLLVSDTHLGLDLPRAPRTRRPRRGDDLFANLERALAPARRGEVDLVVHGGDLFFRSRVALPVVARAAELLAAAARAGAPVVVVPGNHERSRLPYPIFFARPGIHVLDRPRTIELSVRGIPVRLAGFPYARDVRRRFPGLLREAGGALAHHGVGLLCMHQAVEGATVGPGSYTFRDGDDVVRAADLPAGLAAVLSGHIHRAQVLRRDLAGKPLGAPVVYAGSIERISFAERDEPKGAALLELVPDRRGGRLRRASLLPLPARPMHDVRIDATGLSPAALRARVAHRLRELPPRAVVRLSISGATAGPSLAELRGLLPAEGVLWGTGRNASHGTPETASRAS